MSSETNQRHDSTYENLWEIVKQFGKVLETDSSSINLLGIRSESKLAIPKKTIKRSLAKLILLEENKNAIATLASAFLFIENFVDDRIYEYFLPKLKTMGEIRIQSGDISSDEVEKLGTKVLEDLKDTEFQDNFVAIKNAMSKIHKSNENELQILLNLAEKEDLNGDQRKELLV
ncbi:MAG: hypothetical protein GWO07_00060 [Candidatus Dadabacteria bacterium]|nr:hypothetical protein [Candidatus Dadabacteria bacterium]NIS07179.1 hypothetical protein [Candidatus Dadabacteria bacterium]NIV41223.1 hypothetical protein [Candidatus Dadabacteria bacterium]NIX14308.1 hypothetical protein [Candidatus Dadabacteria bacterium]NIY20957.1 hypothetical protein [Candidatus Dadabacteria bacterium]